MSGLDKDMLVRYLVFALASIASFEQCVSHAKDLEDQEDEMKI